MTTEAEDERAIAQVESEATLVKELKKAGIERPPEISSGTWHGPKKLRSRLDLVAFYSAHGLTNRQIAKEMGYTEGRISTILGTDVVKLRVKQIKKEFFSKETSARLDRALPQAMNVLEDALHNRTPGLKAEKVLDASLWLIKQRTGEGEEKAGTVGSLIRTLEEIRKTGNTLTELTKAQSSARAKEAHEAQEIIDINPNFGPDEAYADPDPEDPITAWVNQAIPAQAGKEGK